MTPRTAGRDRSRRRATQACVGALVLLAVANKVGDATAPTLITGAPLLLVFLSPQARYLLLASRTVGTVPLLLTALIRRLSTVPVVYRLGSLHGTGVLGWFDRRFRRIGRMMRAIERWFGKRPGAVTVGFPGGLTAFLAGDVGMRMVPLLGLTAIGLTIRIGFTLWLGEVLSGPLDAVLNFVADNQAPMTALTFGLTAFHVIRQRQKHRSIKAEDLLAADQTTAARPPAEQLAADLQGDQLAF